MIQEKHLILNIILAMKDLVSYLDTFPQGSATGQSPQGACAPLLKRICFTCSYVVFNKQAQELDVLLNKKIKAGDNCEMC